IMRVSENGGEPEIVVPVKEDAIASSPQLLNHGRAILFTLTPRTAVDRLDQSQIVVQSLPQGARKVITSGRDGHYLSSGHLIYSAGGNVLAAPFDISRLEPKGAFVPVIEGVRRFNLFTQLSLSDRGSLIYISGDDSSSGAARNVLALAERS